MSLKQRIDDDLKRAMKARNPVALSAIRLLKSAITNREIELKADLNDAQIVEIVQRQLRQRHDAAQQFRQANRLELAQQEEQEASLLQAYLPVPLTPDQLEQLVDSAIAEVKAQSVKDMSAVMKVALAKAQGRAEGKTVSELVKKKLSTR